jgi:hypothetical protein
MPVLQLKTDILAPESVKTLKFAGYYPSRFLKLIPGLIKEIFRLSSTKFFEDKIKWDKSTDPIEFYGEWRGKDDQDKRTSVWIEVKVQGVQKENDKMGEVTIEISSTLDTKLPYSNFLEKALVRTYSYLFYSEQRRKYVIKARRLLEILEGKLKKELETMGG